MLALQREGTEEWVEQGISSGLLLGEVQQAVVKAMSKTGQPTLMGMHQVLKMDFPLCRTCSFPSAGSSITMHGISVDNEGSIFKHECLSLSF